MTEQTLTEFNSNAATLERIDHLLRLASSASMQNNLLAWYKILESIKKEAIVKMKHTTKEEICVKECIRCQCTQKFEIIKAQIDLYQRTVANKSQLKSRLESQLDDAEIFLRDFMNSKGMLLREMDDAKTALRRG